MSREKILQRIRQNKPQDTALPVLPSLATCEEGKTERFMKVLTSIGGRCSLVEDRRELESLITEKTTGTLVNGWQGTTGFNLESFRELPASRLKDLSYVFLEGSVAVAENGAVWVPERAMVNRLLPFICRHLVLVVRESQMVSTMHEAYQRIKVDEDGYGVFIAGPSKTADIEQSLVVGAHGPLGLEVQIIKGA